MDGLNLTQAGKHDDELKNDHFINLKISCKKCFENT